MNNGYLDEKFDADLRPGVVASLTASSLSKMQYQLRLDTLHTLHNCDTLPSKDIHIKAFTSSKPTKSSSKKAKYRQRLLSTNLKKQF